MPIVKTFSFLGYIINLLYYKYLINKTISMEHYRLKSISLAQYVMSLEKLTIATFVKHHGIWKAQLDVSIARVLN